MNIEERIKKDFGVVIINSPLNGERIIYRREDYKGKQRDLGLAIAGFDDDKIYNMASRIPILMSEWREIVDKREV